MQASQQSSLLYLDQPVTKPVSICSSTSDLSWNVLILVFPFFGITWHTLCETSCKPRNSRHLIDLLGSLLCPPSGISVIWIFIITTSNDLTHYFWPTHPLLRVLESFLSICNRETRIEEVLGVSHWLPHWPSSRVFWQSCDWLPALLPSSLLVHSGGFENPPGTRVWVRRVRVRVSIHIPALFKTSLKTA